VSTDWLKWHEAYLDPASSISQRLAVVVSELSLSLDRAPMGLLKLVSLCAGDGRDVCTVLEGHERRRDVRALLVEQDSELSRRARLRAKTCGGVEVITANAGLSSTIAEHRPFDVVLACGIFGNIAPSDIVTTIDSIASMMNIGGELIWTRHRGDPDLTPSIRRWLHDAGFDEIAFVSVNRTLAAVGRHRLTRQPRLDEPDEVMFRFVGDGSGAHS